MDTGILIPYTLPQVITEVVGVGIFKPATLLQVITEVVGIGILRPATLALVIVDDILVLFAQISQGKKPHTSLHTYAKKVPEATRKKIYMASNDQ